MRAERFFWPASWILAVAVVAAQLLGAGPLTGTLWGADAFAFLPGWTLAVAGLLLAALVLLGLGARASLDRALLRLPTPAGGTFRGAGAWGIGAAAVFFLACWLFREGHTFLGDGHPLTLDLPRGQAFHPHEPLTYLLHHWFYGFAGPLFAAPGRDPTEVARDTVALSSAIAGALFVPVAWGLARELGRALAPDPAAGQRRGGDAAVALLFLLVLFQGYVQLFFGYVENYTFHLLFVGLYLLLALRYLRGGAPLALAGAALALDVSLDLSAVVLAPSFLVLVAWGLVTSGRRLAAARDLVLVAVLAAAIAAGLARARPGFDLAAAVWGVVAQAILGHGSRAESLHYMFSREHVRDFLDEQLLIGPAAALLFVAGVAWLAVARRRPSAPALFLLVAGGCVLAGSWATTDLSLGYPRDWDLFAPLGLTLTVAGLGLLTGASWRAPSLRRCLALLVVLSCFHTWPWIAVNASFTRSFARLKTLPSGLGRTEVVVGTWYLAHGDTAQAIAWFERSLSAYPWNGTAAYSLGRIDMGRGQYRRAAGAFWTALQSRPDKQEFRFSLVDAVVRGGGPPLLAKAQLDTLLASAPDDPVYWAAYGVVCLGAGQPAGAAAAFARARRLAPADPVIGALPARLAQPDGYARAVREDWPALVGP